MADVEPEGATNHALDSEDPTNLLDQLAQKRQVISDTKSVDIRIPGYDIEPPILYARYRLVDGAELRVVGSNVQRVFKGRADRELYANVDIFTRAITGFFYDLGDGELKPLTYKGAPITAFNAQLAQALKFADKIDDPNDARQVVFGLFVHEVPIYDHGMKLNRWFANTGIDVNAAFLGNL